MIVYILWTSFNFRLLVCVSMWGLCFNAQPVSEQRPCPGQPRSQFNCWAWWHMVWNIPLVSQAQLSQLCCLPAPCAPPGCSLVGQCEQHKRPWHCVSTAQQNESVSVSSILFSAQIQNVAPYKLLWRNLFLSQPKPVQHLDRNHSYIEVSVATLPNS